MSIKICYVPFDESEGTTAHDLVSNNNFTLTNSLFVKGKKGNALSMPTQNSFAERIGTTIIDFTADYTLAMWLRVNSGNAESIFLIYKFAGQENYLYLDLGELFNEWLYLTMIQEADKISIFVNGELKVSETFPNGWGTPTGFAFQHDGNGETLIDELQIYEGVSMDSLFPPAQNMDIQYSVNYKTFKSFDVTVSESQGIYSSLQMKEPFKIDWADVHGEVVDLTAPRYQARAISLKCWLHAQTFELFEQKMKGFLDEFYGAGTKRLSILKDGSMSVFEVYKYDAVAVAKRFRSRDMVGEFTLNLVEPQPIKRIIYFVRSAGNTTVSITLTSPKPVNIYWGDGGVSKNVYGTAQTITHTYSTDGEKYVIVAGVVEEITNLSTNGILTNGTNSYF